MQKKHLHEKKMQKIFSNTPFGLECFSTSKKTTALVELLSLFTVTNAGLYSQAMKQIYSQAYN